MKLDLTKAKEILSLLQEDTITPKQAKELVTLLVKLTEKQKQELILKNEDFLSKVSQETFTLIQNALIEIKEKAHDNQLEVRQLTNKQKIAHESKMAQLEALIEEFRNFEIPELDEERLTQDILSKIPKQEEYELVGENVVDSINSLEVTPDKQIDAKHIKNLPQVKQFIGGSSGIKEIVAGTNVTVDNTNPQYPVVSSSGGGGGAVDSVNGQTGVVVLTKSDIGLGNVDNTTDLNKPISTATQTALDGKVDENIAITGATKTKITYDAKGLITSGADATTADIADSSNKRYVTDAQLTVISNTSGINTGDNAVNSLYSGLATSKQDALSGTGFVKISGTTISYDNSTYLTTSSAASTYQPLDTQLTSLAGLSYTGNGGKFLRVNAGETDFEFATVSASAGGSNTQVQFNDSGSLGGDAGLVYSKTNDTLTITSDTSGNGLVVQSAKAAGAGTENLVVIQTTDSLWDRPLLRINDNTSSGGAANIRIDSLNPDIEFVETDQVSPAGKFEVAVNSDKFQINGRSAADSGFEPIATFSRYGSGGMVGIGTLYDTPNAMLEVVSTGTPAYNLSISSAVGATSGNIFNVDGSGNVIINDRGSAVVLRVEGDTDANLLYTDGTNDRVGIGLNNPTQKLHVKGRVQFGVASNTSGTIDLANSGAAGLTRIAPASPSADVTVTLPGVASTLAILGANTFTGTQTLPAGTASAGTAPLYFTSGTNLTSAEAGAQEYDGKVFYSTPVAGARGVSPSTMYAIIDSDFTLTAGTGVQSAFPAGYDVWTLEGSTTYEFEGKYFMTLGTTSRTTALAFALSGGASVTSIRYEAMSWAGQGNATLTAQSSVWVDRVASTVVQAATTNTGTFIKFHGIIRMNAGGTVTPQINFSANPTGTNLMKANSYIKFTPIGSNTMTSVGNVA